MKTPPPILRFAGSLAWMLLGFAAILAAHWPLLRLPYYWDEAGYYIPAAYDFFRSGSLVPYSTLSNAHPPLPSVYLALWWRLCGFSPSVTRTAMCLVAALALAAVYRLARLATGDRMAAALTTLLTALYPVWFVQSTLAHADLLAAAGTLWGLCLLPAPAGDTRKAGSAVATRQALWSAAGCFALAALAKESAIGTPLALAAWELWAATRSRHLRGSGNGATSPGAAGSGAGSHGLAGKGSAGGHLRTALTLATPAVPLAAWFAYHRWRTGFTFGNPEYLRYNATATLAPLRIAFALMHRALHLTAHLNLFVPVLVTLGCLLLPRKPGRRPIEPGVRARLWVVLLANWLFFSVLGGALLTRYLLPLYPLVLLLCVDAWRQRLSRSGVLSLAGLSAAAFVLGLFVNPPYRFAPEDTLAYRDSILLEQDGIAQIEARYGRPTVLTAWPAIDGLTKPELGYVQHPLPVISIDNFSYAQIQLASTLAGKEPAAGAAPYTVALVFSTKYDPAGRTLGWGGWLGRENRALDQRYFAFHQDLPPETIARLLGGEVVWREQRHGQWAAVLHFSRAQVASLARHAALEGRSTKPGAAGLEQHDWSGKTGAPRPEQQDGGRNYNQPVVSMRMRQDSGSGSALETGAVSPRHSCPPNPRHSRRLRWLLALLAAVCCPVASPLWSQSPANSSLAMTNAPPAHGELLLVLPFENQATQPGTSNLNANVDWIGAAVPEILNQRLASAGFLPISRGDRAYALDHLGLPADFRPSHASTLRLAQSLDADYVVLGTYKVDGTRISATARVLDVPSLRMGAPIEEQADLSRLADLLNALAWRVARQVDPHYTVAEQTFVAADANLRLDVFENYIRGLPGPAPVEERLRHLREAVRLDPNDSLAWLALGQTLFASQDYEPAAAAFGHLTRDDPSALEADFYRGLAYFYTGKYLQAEDAFAFVSTRLPLPEVVNNQGVAASRRGKPGAPLFQQAITADPADPDYHFNLAVAMARRADAAGALHELDEVLKARPQDSEAQAFAANLHTPAFVASLARAAQAPVPAVAPLAAAPPGTPAAAAMAAAVPPASAEPAVNLPLERIKRSYNESGFRQAAYAMEQSESQDSAALPGNQRADALVASGAQYLNTGLLVEAEREFNQALAANPNSAAAHAGLAQIRERTGDRDAARAEAQRSLDLAPNVPAHLVLARLDLLLSQLPAAAKEVQAALRLAPADPNARGLKQAVESRGQQVLE